MCHWSCWVLEDTGVDCMQLLVTTDVPLHQRLHQDLKSLHVDQAPALQAPQ